MSVREFAPAKVNLSLHVGPPRADKRHPLASVVLFAGVGDYVWAEAAERPSLALAGPFAPALAQEKDNLVIRAAMALARAAGVRQGVKLTLDKRLPIAAGLGGGSADAAAAMRALNRLWNLKLSAADLAHIGEPLGADVPACMASAACWMTGTGETLAPLETPWLHAVLVNPGAAAPTAQVYAQFDADGGGADLAAEAPPTMEDDVAAIRALQPMRNDLTGPAVKIEPAIGEALALLARMRGLDLVRMSGSGATVFALARSGAHADEVAEAVLQARPDWWVTATRLGGYRPGALAS